MVHLFQIPQTVPYSSKSVFHISLELLVLSGFLPLFHVFFFYFLAPFFLPRLPKSFLLCHFLSSRLYDHFLYHFSYRHFLGHIFYRHFLYPFPQHHFFPHFLLAIVLVIFAPLFLAPFLYCHFLAAFSHRQFQIILFRTISGSLLSVRDVDAHSPHNKTFSHQVVIKIIKSFSLIL